LGSAITCQNFNKPILDVVIE